MAIFLIVPTGDSTKIKNSLVASKNAGNLGVEFLELPKEGFFVSFSGTTQELSTVLGITDGISGNAIVVKVESYYGRASTDIWDWVKSRWNK